MKLRTRLAAIIPAALLAASSLTLTGCGAKPPSCSIPQRDLKLEAGFLVGYSTANCVGNYQPTRIVTVIDRCTDGGIKLVYGKDSRYHDVRYCNRWTNVASSQWKSIFSSPSYLGWVQAWCTGRGRKADEYRLGYKMIVGGVGPGPWIYAYDPARWVYAC